MEKSQQEEEDEEQDNFNETLKQNESKKAVAEAEAQNKIDDIHADSAVMILQRRPASPTWKVRHLSQTC